jgi:hypothetical protein
MTTPLPTDPHYLTDDELISGIATLTGRAREATASLVAFLAELESRDLHRARGYGSLFAYCRGELHLSEHGSYNRMEAARVARRFPVVLPLLAEGLLHLTAVCLLGPHLRDEDHLALLGGAIHKSKSEILELLARWFPKEAVKTAIRAIPSAVERRAAEGRALAEPTAQPSTDPAGGRASHSATAPTSAPAALAAPTSAALDGDALPVLTSPREVPAARGRRGAAEPLSADNFLLRVTARRRTIERLRRAQELLSHAVPSGDVDEILYRALGELIDRTEKEQHGATARPRSGRPVDRSVCEGRGLPCGSRSIPAATRREVWARDGGRCAFVGRTGQRCDGRRFLQYHHQKPWIAGGPPTPGNISLRCRAHNDFEAKVYFGPIRQAMAEAATREVATRSGTSSRPAIPSG